MTERRVAWIRSDSSAGADAPAASSSFPVPRARPPCERFAGAAPPRPGPDTTFMKSSTWRPAGVDCAMDKGGRI